MRQSQAPQTEANHSAYNGKTTLDEARTSQNEADTIATQGGAQSGISPRGQALSQGNFNRLDSEVIATSEANRKPLDNRRFHTSHRQNVSLFRHHMQLFICTAERPETEMQRNSSIL